MTSETQSLSLVPGRQCGACTACCTWMLVEADDFKKPKGVRCPECRDGVGCGIYETRPDVCRGWYCGWRMMSDLGDDLRPDRSGVIVLVVEREPGQEPAVGFNFLLVSKPHAMLDPGFVKQVGWLIAHRFPTWLSGPGLAPGEMPIAHLNDYIHDAAVAGDLDGVASRLAVAVDQLTNVFDLDATLLALESSPFDAEAAPAS